MVPHPLEVHPLVQVTNIDFMGHFYDQHYVEPNHLNQNAFWGKNQTT